MLKAKTIKSLHTNIVFLRRIIFILIFAELELLKLRNLINVIIIPDSGFFFGSFIQNSFSRRI
jgi:hypothetical protein